MRRVMNGEKARVLEHNYLQMGLPRVLDMEHGVCNSMRGDCFCSFSRSALNLLRVSFTRGSIKPVQPGVQVRYPISGRSSVGFDVLIQVMPRACTIIRKHIASPVGVSTFPCKTAWFWTVSLVAGVRGSVSHMAASTEPHVFGGCAAMTMESQYGLFGP